ncbi:MAG: hypothetical protein MI864_28160 [Pseudomonadales bacterium]|nr:hypothetical protein [Pseudomonadales bacterium]
MPSFPKSVLSLVIGVPMTLVLTGCGSSGSSVEPSSCSDPSLRVNYGRGTFRVTENLSRTYFDDFLKGSRASDDSQSESGQLLLAFLTEKIMVATGASGDPGSVNSYNNPLDLIEEAIANDEIANINDGRRMIQQSIADGVSCVYNNNHIVGNKGVFIQAEDSELEYRYTIDFRNTVNSTNPNGDFVTRTIVETTSTQDGSPVDDNLSLQTGATFSSATYSASTFAAQGYDTPWTLIGSFATNDTASATIEKDFLTHNTDTAEYADEEAFTPAPTVDPVKRLKFVIDYSSTEVSIYTSSFIDALEWRCTEGSTACATTLNGETLTNGTILFDPSEELISSIRQLQRDSQFVSDNPEWEVVNYEDPDYDTLDAEPLETYIGTPVLNRAFN